MELHSPLTWTSLIIIFLSTPSRRQDIKNWDWVQLQEKLQRRHTTRFSWWDLDGCPDLEQAMTRNRFAGALACAAASTPSLRVAELAASESVTVKSRLCGDRGLGNGCAQRHCSRLFEIMSFNSVQLTRPNLDTQLFLEAFGWMPVRQPAGAPHHLSPCFRISASSCDGHWSREPEGHFANLGHCQGRITRSQAP